MRPPEKLCNYPLCRIIFTVLYKLRKVTADGRTQGPPLHYRNSAKIWQRSFNDHIIRNERSLNAIREYILDNPVNWEDDIDDLINL